jgi:hypothetical protein
MLTRLAEAVGSRIKNKDRYASLAFSFTLGLVVVLTLSSAASGVNGFDEQIQFVGLTSVLDTHKRFGNLRIQTSQPFTLT